MEEQIEILGYLLQSNMIASMQVRDYLHVLLAQQGPGGAEAAEELENMHKNGEFIYTDLKWRHTE